MSAGQCWLWRHCGERQRLWVGEREEGLRWHWAAVGFLLRVSSGTQLSSTWGVRWGRAPVLSLFGKWRPWDFGLALCEVMRASTLPMALQFSVSLQTEESIQEEFQRRRGQPVSFTTHARHQEACLHTAQSSFSLPIPLSSTPGFTTNIG